MNKMGKFHGDDHARTNCNRNVIFLLSVDGSLHQVTMEGDANLINFSITVINNVLSMLGNTTIKSFHMLTFKRIAADEKRHEVLCTHEKVLERRKKFSQRCNDLCAVVAFKFMYLDKSKIQCKLTQHSLQNRSRHPFLIFLSSRRLF